LTGFFWTSASSEGPLNGDHPGWCATKKFVKLRAWDYPADKTWSLMQYRFLRLFLNASDDTVNHLRDEDEEKKYDVICEKN
jgi:hypothetical protein